MIENITTDGEHFTPYNTSYFELKLNLERYMKALRYCENKVVLELGCGAGLGTYLYSLVAKKVIAVDYSDVALNHARTYPRGAHGADVEFLKLNLETADGRAQLPAHDICIALEVLEHLEDPKAVLRDLKGNEIFFSVPLHSMEVSAHHKYRIDTVGDARELVNVAYDLGDLDVQKQANTYASWVMGYGIRFTSNE